MDNDFTADIPDIIESIRSSDVVVLKFVTIGERLLIDFRSSDLDAPMIRVVPRVRSVAERYRMLRACRPRFVDPDLMSFCWPMYMESLRRTGVFDVIVERLAQSGYACAVEEAERVWRMLVHLEREYRRRAISGAGFRTLWSAASATR